MHLYKLKIIFFFWNVERIFFMVIILDSALLIKLNHYLFLIRLNAPALIIIFR